MANPFTRNFHFDAGADVLSAVSDALAPIEGESRPDVSAVAKAVSEIVGGARANVTISGDSDVDADCRKRVSVSVDWH